MSQWILFLWATSFTAATVAGMLCAPEQCVPVRDCPHALTLLATEAGTQRLRGRVCSNKPGNIRVCCAWVRSVDKSKSFETSSDKLPSSCGVTFSHRVLGGVEAKLGQFPWMVALFIYKTSAEYQLYVCGGSLINERYVLTAAHCLDPVRADSTQVQFVKLGEHDLFTNPDCDSYSGACAPAPLKVEVENIIIHPQFRRPHKYSNDIALIRLKDSVQYTMFISPICLDTVSPVTAITRRYGLPVTTAGFGRSNFGSVNYELNTANLFVTNARDCKSTFPRAYNEHSAQICVRGFNGSDTCGGDSGSPVWITSKEGINTQVGLVSFGVSNCGSGPGVYTYVPSYIHSFIVPNLKP